jgi:hypothetical protein
MKKNILFMTVIVVLICLTGCSIKNKENFSENIKKMELTGNLVTYEAYYHNVIEYTKKHDSGLLHTFEKDRKLFVEYSGTIKLGIDLSKVKIELNGNEINVSIPKAKIIGDPNVDNDDFDANKFIESEDGLFKNPITADDSTEAFNEAQENMKKDAENDEALLLIAQKRAKIILEENINQLGGFSEKKYTINWIYEL